ncbi:C-type lectin BfL-2-like [Branchiostoma floridae]|uniref:C-type lectin BfL-2-like n=1 Tax=Branchiostoma floridae TaxID=7739 RepID=A0A9J7L7Z0_BRAFL|nr:C-type lectin BfL-2-like [Branchiostoma floridae]
MPFCYWNWDILDTYLVSPGPCPVGYTHSEWSPWPGICYKAFNTPKTFSESAETCVKDGGTLAIPRDANTNDFLIKLKNTVDHTSTYWFGLDDRHMEGSFEWADGTRLYGHQFDFWAPGEPNDFNNFEDCVHYEASQDPEFANKWDDGSCDTTAGFICEVIPGSAE